MAKKTFPIVEVTLEKIVGGGQALGTLEDGRKVFVWGGLPDETVRVQINKKKSSYAEGVVVEVLKASPDRVAPKDPNSFLSTSPWQIMSRETENHYKSALIEEAFELHDLVLPAAITVYDDERDYGYRNKVEFSFWHDTDTDTVSLAFFRRGTHGKITVDGTSLAADVINEKGRQVLTVLNELGIQ
ncbi:MAG: TRAM domain-containing protein, partial [Candidatus Microsaccharimonas sp.]